MIWVVQCRPDKISNLPVQKNTKKPRKKKLKTLSIIWIEEAEDMRIEMRFFRKKITHKNWSVPDNMRWEKSWDQRSKRFAWKDCTKMENLERETVQREGILEYLERETVKESAHVGEKIPLGLLKYRANLLEQVRVRDAIYSRFFLGLLSRQWIRGLSNGQKM